MAAAESRLLAFDDAGTHADHLGECPERDALAVGEAAAAVPPDAFLDAVHVLEELPPEPRLADPGDAGHGDELRAPLVDRGVEELLDETKLAVPPDEGRLEARRLERAAAARGHAERAPECDLLGLTLEVVLSGRGVRDGGLRRSLGRLTDEDGAGSAADWIRAAVLTRSPATIPCPSAPSVTAASPVRTPARACRRGVELGNRREKVERGTDCALRVVLRRRRRAPDGHDGIADELLDCAAVALDRCRVRCRSSARAARGSPRRRVPRTRS